MRFCCKIIVVIALAAALCGCGPWGFPNENAPAATKPPAVWCVSDMAPLTDRTEQFVDSDVNSATENVIDIASAANETVSFQLVFDASDAGARALKLELTDFGRQDGTMLESESVCVFRMIPTPVDEYPAWYLRISPEKPVRANMYDQLVPITAPKGGQPYEVRPGGRECFWVDVAVPPTAYSGVYRGTIKILDGETELKRVVVQLKVEGFILPSIRLLPAIGSFGHRELLGVLMRGSDGKAYDPAWLNPQNPQGKQAIGIINNLMLLAHAHHLDIFDTDLKPLIKRDDKGYLQLDWTGFDAVATPYLTGKAFRDETPMPAWPIPFDNTFPNPVNYGGINSIPYRLAAREFILQSARHLRSCGNEDQVFAWPYRGDVNAKAFEDFTTLGEMIRRADDSLPILCSLPDVLPKGNTWKIPPDMKKYCDIVAPGGEWFDPKKHANRSKPENPLIGTWLSPANPPYMPDMSMFASPADIRALPWFALKYKCSALFFGNVINWNDPRNSANLFYPGSRWGIDGTLPSVRLKRLRRGMQDIAYLWILRQRGRAAQAQQVVDMMVRYGGLAAAGDNYLDARIDGWVADSPTWNNARDLLAEEINQAISQTPADPAEAIAQRVRWRHLADATQTLRAERVRAKVHAEKTTDNRTPKLFADVSVDFFNEYPNATKGYMSVLRMPFGWKRVQDRVSYDVKPGGRKTLSIAIEGEKLPYIPNGKIPVDIRVNTDQADPVTLLTEVPIVIAGEFKTSPKIDGDLADWPDAGNTAGDFRLLGRRGQTGSGLAQRQTTVYAMQDDENVYFAFYCKEPAPDAIRANASNTIRYDRLLACGEDYVEVILAPGGQAKQPQDLYHIMVKPNGVVIQEHGIGCQPPLGKAQREDFGTVAAVSKGADCWIAEIKIPRKSFGDLGDDQFWGVNFTRFATPNQEASSWAGTERYFYDPQSLGTLIFSKPKN